MAGRISRSALLRKADHPVASGLVSRKARDANGVADGAEHEVSRASSSAGSPLPETLMRKFEGSLGADLSGVRVHTGSESAAANEAVGARAYTMDQDIHFAAGQYNPSTRAGEHLLAHEVAHTVQQAGAARSVQYKLEVSQPGDALEHAADAAADAMIAGLPASVGSAGAGVSRQIFRDADPSYGTIQGAGDAAAAEAMNKSLTVDSISVTKDMSDVNDTVADITKNSAVLEAAKERDIPRKQEYVAVNTEAVMRLSIFKDKLNVSSVDTSAFAMQYRIAHADFQRLNGEAHEMLQRMGVKSADELGTVSDGIGNVSGLKLDASVELLGFEAARRNLNTAATKMNGQISAARIAANQLQAAMYRVQAAVASAKEKDDQAKLDAVKGEIAAVAGGVGKVVKLVTTVAGFAGGGSATAGAAASTLKEPTTATIEGADVGHLKGTALGDVISKQHDVDLGSEGSAGKQKLAILKGMYGDAGQLNQSDNAVVSSVLSGDPAKIAEQLVTLVGEHANKKKMEKLQTAITKSGAQAKVLQEAADSLSMDSTIDALNKAVGDLNIQVGALASAKRDMAVKSDALMAKLAAGAKDGKGGKKGSDQAKVVLFLADADRFLAQVENAISVGVNQQTNMEIAAKDRKKLRGTDAPYDADEEDRSTQHYYRCSVSGKKPWHEWGTNYYNITRMDVKFTGHDNVADPNVLNQGGAGTIEGVGGAADSVANKIQALKTAQAKVKKLQTACQDALFGKGKGEAGLNG